MAYLAPTSDFVTTTLNGAIVAADDTATIGTGLDLPATNGILQIDYDSTTAVGLDDGPETIAYATYTSGTGALAGMTRGLNGTTAVDHSDGSSVQCGPSASYWGTGSILTADLADDIITNAKLDTTAGEPGGAWKAWTPTWANFTPGSATINAKYTQIGKTVVFHLVVTLNGSTMGSAPTFTVPVTASSNYVANAEKLWPVHIEDTGTATYIGRAGLTSTTVAAIVVLNAAGTYLTNSAITVDIPMTWANTDTFSVTGTYEAA